MDRKTYKSAMTNFIHIAQRLKLILRMYNTTVRVLAASSLIRNQLPSRVTMAKIKHTNKSPHTARLVFLIPHSASLRLLCHDDWAHFTSSYPLFLIVLRLLWPLILSLLDSTWWRIKNKMQPDESTLEASNSSNFNPSSFPIV